MSLLHHVQTAMWPTGLPIRRVHGHESDHFTHSSAKVNNNNNLCYSLMCPRGVYMEKFTSFRFDKSCVSVCLLSAQYMLLPDNRIWSYACQLLSPGRLMYAYIHVYIRTYIHIYIYIYSMDPLVCRTDSRMWNTS